MSVLLETSLGDIVVDLETARCPRAALNFLKLCKAKRLNHSLFVSVQRSFLAQVGGPLGEDDGGESVWGLIHGAAQRYFNPEIHPKLKHVAKGTVSFATANNAFNISTKSPASGTPLAGSHFFITTADHPLDYLDGKHAVFGYVAEGLDVLDKINAALVDDNHRPLKDIRIKHTIILEDPFDDPPGLSRHIPDRSPSPTPQMLKSARILDDEEITVDVDSAVNEELEKEKRRKEAEARSLTLEMVGDLPFAEIKPPENVLFVCKLNPVTRDEDLELIFSRFGNILSCEIVRDRKTGDSLCYAFIEFDSKDACEEAYFKMDNVLIDDRRIHVDFSQSVARLHKEFLMGAARPLQDAQGTELRHKNTRRDYGLGRDNGDAYEMVFEHNQHDDGRSRSRGWSGHANAYPSSATSASERHINRRGSYKQRSRSPSLSRKPKSTGGDSTGRHQKRRRRHRSGSRDRERR